MSAPAPAPRRPAVAAVKVLVGLGVLAVLAWRVDLGAVGRQLGRVAPWALAASLPVYVATALLQAWRWRVLLRSRRIGTPQPPMKVPRRRAASGAAGQGRRLPPFTPRI